ncbi:hypothetical protein D9611_008264 [Ephemerocybe angulata]|uniref:Uncharacterized protein n=1 Tax=Ephemerocybe angulata TaxID=980116 RepID=A0A8H5BIH7_9AGAR|nr:hypothetical protein D9611_008264 [Tulosesus angulatus]
MYNLLQRVTGKHLSSVNCIQFSTDGQYIASGDDNGSVLVFKTDEASQYDRYHFDASVTAIGWMPGNYGLFVGLANCELQIVPFGNNRAYSLNFQPKGYRDLSPELQKLFQVNCLSIDLTTSCVALGVGTSVVILSQIDVQSKSWQEEWTIRSPNDDEINPAGATNPPISLGSEVRSLQFIESGRKLVVTYLEAGVYCYRLKDKTKSWDLRPLSYRFQRIICSNAYDGFDIYNLRSGAHTTKLLQAAPVDANVALPALFIHQDRDVLLGSARGPPSIFSTDGKHIETLQDGSDDSNDMIQAIDDKAYFSTKRNGSYIVTACAEKEEDTYVKIWHQASTAPSDSDNKNTALEARTSRQRDSDLAHSTARSKHLPGRSQGQPNAVSRRHTSRRRLTASSEEEGSDESEDLREDEGGQGSTYEDLKSQDHTDLERKKALGVVGCIFLFIVFYFSGQLGELYSFVRDIVKCKPCVSRMRSFLLSLADKLGGMSDEQSSFANEA